MQAKKKKIDFIQPVKGQAQLEMKCLKHPRETNKQVEILGEGASAVPRIVEVFKKLELL